MPLVATDLGPFADCTSNQVLDLARIGIFVTDDDQADSYTELLNPQRAALLKKSAALGREILSEYPGVTFEELAMEISVRIPTSRSREHPVMPAADGHDRWSACH
jgi:hypothetical protein